MTKKRRFMVPRSAWRVVSDPDHLLSGRYLHEAIAKEMLAYGDFYADGTVLYIDLLDMAVYVKGTSIYVDRDCTEKLTYSIKFKFLPAAKKHCETSQQTLTAMRV